MEEILLFNFFFRSLIYALVAEIQPDKIVRWCTDGELLGDFLRPVFPAIRVQHISDLHSKFALRPHHVWNYGRQRLRIGEEKKKKEERRNHRTKIEWSALLGGHDKLVCTEAEQELGSC